MLNRKVIVDDRLPVDRRNKPICCASNTGNELWVRVTVVSIDTIHTELVLVLATFTH